MPAASPSPSPITVPSQYDEPLSRIVSEEVPSPASVVSDWEEGQSNKPVSKWRHTIGIILLLTTVVLWTASNFLASTIFADDTYSKPYLVTYVNTSFFLLPILPLILKHAIKERSRRFSFRSLLRRRVGNYALITQDEADDAEPEATLKHDGADGSAATELLLASEHSSSSRCTTRRGAEKLTLYETARLSVEFCIPWFVANYFTAACLEYTTVASSTILASTSSVWTLLFGSLLGVELFSYRKLFGVLASLAGIILISLVDISGSNDENRGEFPHKSRSEIMIGDGMAFLSAVLYGGYTIFMKKRIGDESRVNMPLFFGFIGFFNVLCLWPGFVILHYTGVEKFEMPPNWWVTTIVLVNSASSLLADITWAYALLLTSPLITTVGLSLTIPLSLIGQMILDSQYSSALYWVGACIVFLSFIFINQEEKRAEETPAADVASSRHIDVEQRNVP